jgi:hypothetical protein
MRKNEIIIVNRIDEVMKQKNMKPDYVCRRYEELTGKKLSTDRLWRWRKNKHNLNLFELTNISLVLKCKMFCEIVDRNPIN